MTPDTEPAGSAGRSPKKPLFALACATSLGVGCLPKAPGTFGSIVGCVVAVCAVKTWHGSWGVLRPDYAPDAYYWVALIPSVLVFAIVAMMGVWSSARVATFAGIKDPQYVVIDEVSGQHLAFLFGLVPAYVQHNPNIDGVDSVFAWRMAHVQYLIAGFVLFRLFDIWKPWPIRKLESLPGGWGIMADDWLAGIYAAILLRLALHFNVL